MCVCVYLFYMCGLCVCMYVCLWVCVCVVVYMGVYKPVHVYVIVPLCCFSWKGLVNVAQGQLAAAEQHYPARCTDH